jgi:NAD dependent epimerase/dehydratase family enzyme
VNICSPNPVTNREFLRALRAAWGQPIGFPNPARMIEIGSFPSVITLKPAIRYQFKTGQRDWPKT